MRLCLNLARSENLLSTIKADRMAEEGTMDQGESHRGGGKSGRMGLGWMFRFGKAGNEF